MLQLPSDQHHLSTQYRKCGKPTSGKFAVGVKYWTIPGKYAYYEGLNDYVQAILVKSLHGASTKPHSHAIAFHRRSNIGKSIVLTNFTITMLATGSPDTFWSTATAYKAPFFECCDRNNLYSSIRIGCAL